MDSYTKLTKNNLEERFQMTVDGVYYPHQPIYGYRNNMGPTSRIARYMVTKSILNALNRFSFNSFADIGGAEGYTANLVRTLFNAQVTVTDLSENACQMAKEIFDINAIAADIHKLPFKDSEFEIVLCSETIEHVTDYKLAITELLRIALNVLIITVPHETKKSVARNIANKVPHGHIHYFDIKTLDYLKSLGYCVRYEKTLSPLLIIPRVIAEGFKKPTNKFRYRLYNLFTPIFKKTFGIRTANWLTNMDTYVSNLFGLYQGITFTIEKTKVKYQSEQKQANSLIKAEMFTDIKVNEHKIK